MYLVFYLVCRYCHSLQRYPRLKNLLNSYQADYQRTVASIFTKEQIFSALCLEDSSPEMVLRKAAMALSYLGGLRGHELRSLKYGDVAEDQVGYIVRFEVAKQKGEVKESFFLVPTNFDNPRRCFSAVSYTHLTLPTTPYV